MTRRPAGALVGFLVAAAVLTGCSGDSDTTCPEAAGACASPPPSPSTPTGTHPSYSAGNDFPGPSAVPTVEPSTPVPPLTPGTLVPQPSGGVPIPIPSAPED